jgi:hypothetical protein
MKKFVLLLILFPFLFSISYADTEQRVGYKSLYIGQKVSHIMSVCEPWENLTSKTGQEYKNPSDSGLPSTFKCYGDDTVNLNFSILGQDELIKSGGLFNKGTYFTHDDLRSISEDSVITRIRFYSSMNSENFSANLIKYLSTEYGYHGRYREREMYVDFWNGNQYSTSDSYFFGDEGKIKLTLFADQGLAIKLIYSEFPIEGFEKSKREVDF